MHADRRRPALGQRTGLSGFSFFLQVAEYFLDHYRVFNARYDFHGAAAFTTRFDVDVEYALLSLCPGHGHTALGGGFFSLVQPRAWLMAFAPLGRCHQRAMLAWYVQHVNRTYRRSGTLWEGRYRSCLIQSEIYLYTCHRYIELNPVRAKLADHPADYPWSSYRANGLGMSNGILKPHPLYKALGRDLTERQIAYRELYRHELGPDVIDEIRKSTNGNYVLGDRRFAEQIEAKLGRRATPGRSGRPKHDLECN